MNWIIVSLFLILGSTILYLTLRNIDKYSTPTRIKNLVIFWFPILPLLIYSLVKEIPLFIEWKYIAMLFFSALLLSWPASVASLVAIKEAPNPWYSLIVWKSYVIYTTLFSILFFDSEFSLFKILIIFLILFFAWLIFFDQTWKAKNKKIKSKRRIYLSLFTFFAWWNLALISTYLLGKWIPATIINIYLLSFVTILLSSELLIKKEKYKPKNKNEILNLIIIGISFSIFQQAGIYWANSEMKCNFIK